MTREEQQELFERTPEEEEIEKLAEVVRLNKQQDESTIPHAVFFGTKVERVHSNEDYAKNVDLSQIGVISKKHQRKITDEQIKIEEANFVDYQKLSITQKKVIANKVFYDLQDKNMHLDSFLAALINSQMADAIEKLL